MRSSLTRVSTRHFVANASGGREPGPVEREPELFSLAMCSRDPLQPTDRRARTEEESRDGHGVRARGGGMALRGREERRRFDRGRLCRGGGVRSEEE
eukprot:3027694-Rhodomonas_salina.1